MTTLTQRKSVINDISESQIPKRYKVTVFSVFSLNPVECQTVFSLTFSSKSCSSNMSVVRILIKKGLKYYV